MKILVLAKQVPDTWQERELSLETGWVVRDGAAEPVPDEISERVMEVALGWRDAGADIEVVAFNDLGDDATQAHLLRYDSILGRFGGQVDVVEGGIEVDGRLITSLAERDPAQLPWGDLGVDVVVEVAPVARPDTTWVHAIRCAVITDADGEPDYLVLVIDDQTDRYEAEDRFESAFNANPAPALICRVSDLCFIRANQGFLAMTGLGRDEVVGHSIYELDILRDVDDRSEALAKLTQGETIAQSEATLLLPDGSSKGVIVAGQPLDLSNERCMLFTFVDLERRLQAEALLRQSEERFSKAFKSSPVALAVAAASSLRFIEVNGAFLALTGFAEDELVDSTPANLRMWADPGTQERLLRELETSDKLTQQELRIRTFDDTVLDGSIAGDVISIDDTRCVLIVLQDITERRRSETELMSAIDAVLADTAWLSRGIVERLAGLRQPNRVAQAGVDLASLTDREREVLARLAGCSERTVHRHLANIYAKLSVTDRLSAVVTAQRIGLLVPPHAHANHSHGGPACSSSTNTIVTTTTAMVKRISASKWLLTARRRRPVSRFASVTASGPPRP